MVQTCAVMKICSETKVKNMASNINLKCRCGYCVCEMLRAKAIVC